MRTHRTGHDSIVLFLVHACLYDRLIRKQYNSQLCHYWRMYINSWNSNLHFQTKDNLSAYGKLSGQTFPGRQGQRKQ